MFVCWKCVLLRKITENTILAGPRAANEKARLRSSESLELFDEPTDHENENDILGLDDLCRARVFVSQRCVGNEEHQRPIERLNTIEGYIPLIMLFVCISATLQPYSLVGDLMRSNLAWPLATLYHHIVLAL